MSRIDEAIEAAEQAHIEQTLDGKVKGQVVDLNLYAELLKEIELENDND